MYHCIVFRIQFFQAEHFRDPTAHASFSAFKTPEIPPIAPVVHVQRAELPPVEVLPPISTHLHRLISNATESSNLLSARLDASNHDSQSRVTDATVDIQITAAQAAQPCPLFRSIHHQPGFLSFVEKPLCESTASSLLSITQPARAPLPEHPRTMALSASIDSFLAHSSVSRTTSSASLVSRPAREVNDNLIPPITRHEPFSSIPSQLHLCDLMTPLVNGPTAMIAAEFSSTQSTPRVKTFPEETMWYEANSLADRIAWAQRQSVQFETEMEQFQRSILKQQSAWTGPHSDHFRGILSSIEKIGSNALENDALTSFFVVRMVIESQINDILRRLNGLPHFSAAKLFHVLDPVAAGGVDNIGIQELFVSSGLPCSLNDASLFLRRCTPETVRDIILFSDLTHLLSPASAKDEPLSRVMLSPFRPILPTEPFDEAAFKRSVVPLLHDLVALLALDARARTTFLCRTGLDVVSLWEDLLSFDESAINTGVVANKTFMAWMQEHSSSFSQQDIGMFIFRLDPSHQGFFSYAEFVQEIMPEC
jgi:hypothetical protein